MKKNFIHFYFLRVIVIVILEVNAFASSSKAISLRLTPSDAKEAIFSLLFVTPQPNLFFSASGHVILRLKINSKNIDQTYEWDMKTPHSFFEHQSVALYETEAYMVVIRSFAGQYEDLIEQKRGLQEARIKLSIDSKQKMLVVLQKITEQRNQINEYNTYFVPFKVSCSIPIRNLLNQALNGKLKQHLSSIPSNNFLRLVKSHFINQANYFRFIQLIANRELHQKRTQWDNALFPISLVKSLSHEKMTLEKGKASYKLLGSWKNLLSYPQEKATISKQLDYFSLFLNLCLALLTLALILALLTKYINIKIKCSSVLFGSLLFFWGVFSGGLGGWLTYVSQISTSDYSGEGLLFFWPLDLIYCFMGVLVLKNQSAHRALFFWIIPSLHLIVSSIYFSAKIFNFINRQFWLDSYLIFLIQNLIFLNLIFYNKIAINFKFSLIKSKKTGEKDNEAFSFN